MITLGSRQPQRGVNLIKCEAKLTRTADEPEPHNILAPVASKPRLGSMGRREQPNPFVLADRLDIALRAMRQLAYRDYRGRFQGPSLPL